MSSYDQHYQQGLYLSPDQQDLLLAALSSNQPPQNTRTPQAKSDHSPDHASSSGLSAPSSGNFEGAHLNQFGFGDDESPFLDFPTEVDFDFPASADLIGELPGSAYDYEPGDKRKSMNGEPTVETEETGKKRRESEAKKPGRKPLTSEPTTVRLSQLLTDWTGDLGLSNIHHRSEKHRIGPLRGHSASARRSTSKI